MRRSRKSLLKPAFLATMAGAALLVPAAMAQQASESLRGPDGGTQYHVSGIEVLSVAGKPFTAKDSIEWTRKLEDGSTVTTRLIAAMARDSQGRVYRERRSFVPATESKESRLNETIVYDPASRTKTVCVLATKQCTIANYRPMSKFAPLPVGAFAGGTRTLERKDLGTNVVDDLNVTGTNETVTTAAGVLGNDRPLVTTREFWYSPDLETNVAVTREDPREGTQYIHLIDLSRSEPDPGHLRGPSRILDPRSSPQRASTPGPIGELRSSRAPKPRAGFQSSSHLGSIRKSGWPRVFSSRIADRISAPGSRTATPGKGRN